MLHAFWRSFARHFDSDDPVNNMMPWFGQALDPGDGRMRLGRCWYAPWRRELRLDWSYTRSQVVIDAMIDAHKRLSAHGRPPCHPANMERVAQADHPSPIRRLQYGRHSGGWCR
ncbi:hypothetical protein [Paraburkholderia sp. HD33-4]|uniref:hypothetical protein n=1 Tax=Paraburkholderia sp. HD33-4 TaxID=2883242 RepID=UPI001F19435A|nr:hypothetical protein [Paraburkholderia sp. HD33-4]